MPNDTDRCIVDCTTPCGQNGGGHCQLIRVKIREGMCDNWTAPVDPENDPMADVMPGGTDPD